MVKRSFFNVGTICEKMMGVSKGVKSLGSGFPIGVSSIPIGTRFCLQSLVCYTFPEVYTFLKCKKPHTQHLDGADMGLDASSA